MRVNVHIGRIASWRARRPFSGTGFLASASFVSRSLVRAYAILTALGRGLCLIGVSAGGGAYTLGLYQSPSSLPMVSSFPSVVIKDAVSGASVYFYLSCLLLTVLL